MSAQTVELKPTSFHEARLQASPLFIRREADAIEARRRAVEAAFEYGSTKRNSQHGAFETVVRA